MAEKFGSGWVGGPLFSKQKKWANGTMNDGKSKKKRFNPNPTACSHSGCQIAAQSRRDKEKYASSPRVVKS